MLSRNNGLLFLFGKLIPIYSTCMCVCFTVRLHVMQRTVLLSQFYLSVRYVYCDKTK